MKRPLASVALIYVGGLLAANFIPLPLGWLLLVSLTLAWLTLRCGAWRSWLLALLLFLAGATNLTWRTAVISPHDLRVMMDQSTELVVLRGRLLETPLQRMRVYDDQVTWRSLARIETLELRLGKRWEAAVGEVMVTTPGLLPPNFFGGQTVEITGVLRPPPGRVAEGLFDYRTYLRWKGIHYELKSQSTNDWRLWTEVPQPTLPPLADRFQIWAQQTLARGLPAVDEDLRLLWAMTLGWQTALTSEVSEPFMQSGTMHIFAISGLHIALIAGILVQLLRLLQVPRAACGLIVVPLIWFYTAATGWQASAIRSTIMMTVVIAGWALKRPGDLLNSLCASGVIILLWQPQQLFQAGFQLSFFVVLSIALLMPPFEKVRQRLLQTDPLLPEELRPRWRRRLDTPLHWIITSLATSLAAWLGSLPLIANYFHLVTPVSLLANLVIVPLSGLALMCNLGGLVCGSWLPWLTELFNHSAWLWMHWMVGLSDWFVKWPGAFFYVRSPTVTEFIFYDSMLLVLLSAGLLSLKHRLWIAVVPVAAALIWCVSGWRERHTIRLTILPLNGGHAMFVDAPGRSRDLLINCGDEKNEELVVKPFLHGQGINRLQKMLLTHGDLRHVGGADLALKDFSIGQVLTSSTQHRSPAYRQVLENLRSVPERWRQINRNDEVEGWRVLHPEAQDQFAQADDSVIVVQREIHGTRILLLSDFSQAGQKVLLKRQPDLHADIVISGLPRQVEPLSDTLLDAVQPQVIIVCTAEYPATERPSRLLCRRLGRRGIPVVYTHESGTVTLTLRPRQWELKGMNEIHFQGEPR